MALASLQRTSLHQHPPIRKQMATFTSLTLLADKCTPKYVIGVFHLLSTTSPQPIPNSKFSVFLALVGVRQNDKSFKLTCGSARWINSYNLSGVIQHDGHQVVVPEITFLSAGVKSVVRDSKLFPAGGMVHSKWKTPCRFTEIFLAT